MANIFGFHEQELLAHIEESRYYVRYVDDTFCVLENEVETRAFHQAIHCTWCCISQWKMMTVVFFLFLMSAYTAQIKLLFFFNQCTRNQPLWVYIHMGSFCSKQLEIYLIKTRVHWAVETTLDSEIEFIRTVLSENSYLQILESSIREKNATIF